MPKKLAISIIVLVALLLPLIVPVGTAFATTHTTPLETTPLVTTPLETTPLVTTPLETTPLVTTPTNDKKGSTRSYCINQTGDDRGNLLQGIITTGGGLFALNFLTSGLADPPSGGASVAGFGANFNLGGVLEPFDEVVDKLFDRWMWVVGLGLIGTLAVHIMALLVDYGLVLNASLGADNTVLSTGYNIILELVNLGFVIAIVVMAFATMFRREGWNIKSSLIKLVIAAVLINFSLFFGLQVSNFSNKLTGVMLGNVCPGESLASTFSFSRTYSVIEKTLDSSNNPGGSVRKGMSLSDFYDAIDDIPIAIIALFFGAVLTIVGAATLLGLFLFLMARYVMIIILLVFMPFIWLSFIFPKLNMPGIGDVSWNGWWEKYLKWNLNGPLIAFFLYLTALMSNYLNDPKTIASIAGQGFVSGLAQILVVIVFSLAGLYMANKLGIAGASMVYGGVAKVGKKGLARLRASGIKMAGAPLRTKTAEKIMSRMTEGKVVIPGTKFTIPGTKDVGRLGMRAEAYGRKQAEAEANKYKNLTPEQQNKVLGGLPPNSAHAKIMEDLMKRDKLENPEQYLTAKTKASFNRHGHEGIYKSLEQYAVATIESIEALARDDIGEAARIVQKEILALAKPGDIGKKIKLSRVFNRPSLDKFKNKDGTYNRQAHAKAVYENNIRARVVTRALLSDSPEKIVATFKSLSPGKERAAFNAAKDNMLSELKLVGKASVIPKKVNDYLGSSAGRKLFNNLYSEPEKEMLSREDIETMIKENKDK